DDDVAAAAAAGALSDRIRSRGRAGGMVRAVRIDAGAPTCVILSREDGEGSVWAVRRIAPHTDPSPSSRLRMTPDLQLALELADAADAISLRGFRSTFTVRTKADRTPVTEVDEAVERSIREILERERPDDGIVGEEFGARG